MACGKLYAIAAALLLLPACLAGTFTVEWTVQGVNTYSCFGLGVDLEDKLIFQCTNGSFSNIVYQSDQAQFDACNTSATAGQTVAFADCRGSERNVTLNLDSQSGSLGSGVPISAGDSLYFTSYSTGTSQSATSDVSQGGECLTGLKLAVHIAGGNSQPSLKKDADGNCIEDPDATQPGGPGTQPGGPGGIQPDDSSSNIAVIAAAGGGGAVLVLVLVLVVVLLVCCCCCFYNRKKKRASFIKVSVDCEKGRVVTAVNPVAVKTVTQMNGSGAPVVSRTEVDGSGTAVGKGEKQVPPQSKPNKFAKSQPKSAASNGSALQQPHSSSPRPGAKKNDPTGVAASSRKPKPRPNRVAPGNPRAGSKSGVPGDTSSKNSNVQNGSASHKDSAPSSRASSSTVAKPSTPPVFVQSGTPKPAKAVVNTNKKTDNATHNAASNPAHKTVTVASSRSAHKPSALQGSQQKDETAAVSDREPAVPGQRRTAPPPPAPPAQQQKLPPLQRSLTDAGQQSRERQAPLSSQPPMK